jgi:two-component system, LytTR family, sensor kinase
VPLKLWMIHVQQQRDTVSIVHLSYVGALVLFATLFISFVQFSLRFFERWQHSEIDAERWQRESAEAKLLVLQNQLDPHFLFNSLNLVYGLIGEQPRQAEKLLLTLAEVLRFALAHGDRELVTLAEEMAFADAWAALLLARHGSALEIERRIAPAALPRRLPPYSVQLLLENALKHNALDPAAPLHVVIEADSEYVSVHHVRRPRREPVSGHGRGLTSIAGRYRLLGAAAPKIEAGTEFRVVLPLLDER